MPLGCDFGPFSDLTESTAPPVSTKDCGRNMDCNCHPLVFPGGKCFETMEGQFLDAAGLYKFGLGTPQYERGGTLIWCRCLAVSKSSTMRMRNVHPLLAHVCVCQCVCVCVSIILKVTSAKRQWS